MLACLGFFPWMGPAVMFSRRQGDKRQQQKAKADREDTLTAYTCNTQQAVSNPTTPRNSNSPSLHLSDAQKHARGLPKSRHARDTHDAPATAKKRTSRGE
eukprot:365014-Chlamydomonas_euryale.AAC.11